jgi:hypothetical protein
MIKNRGRCKTAPTRWETRSKTAATGNYRLWAGTLHALPEVCMVGRVFLTNCFAFIASFAQNTADFKC